MLYLEKEVPSRRLNKQNYSSLSRTPRSKNKKPREVLNWLNKNSWRLRKSWKKSKSHQNRFNNSQLTLWLKSQNYQPSRPRKRWLSPTLIKTERRRVINWLRPPKLYHKSRRISMIVMILTKIFQLKSSRNKMKVLMMNAKP